jgi:tetratricopeptide (TPR) repeat protein
MKSFVAGACAPLTSLNAEAQDQPSPAASTAASKSDSAGPPQIFYPDPDVGVFSLPERKKAQLANVDQFKVFYQFQFTDKLKESGITFVRDLVKAHPNDAIYWATLGDVLRRAGSTNRPAALRACRKALAIDPGYAHAQFVMATILLEAGDFAAARTLLENLERVSPNELEAHVALARVYSRLGKPDFARKETEIVNKLREGQASEDAPAPKGGSGSLEQR